MGDKITKQDVIDFYEGENGVTPEWSNKLFREMSASEINEYQKLRIMIKRARKNPKTKPIEKPIPKVIEHEKELTEELSDEDFLDFTSEPGSEKTYEVKNETITPEQVRDLLEKKGLESPRTPKQSTSIPEMVSSAQNIINSTDKNYYDTENKWPDEEKYNLVSNTAQKSVESLLTPEQKGVLEKQKTQDEFIEDYLRHHNIKTQSHLNYAIEHDEKFKIFLEKTDRLKSLYNGKQLNEMKLLKEKVDKELEKDAKKDKGKKIFNKFKTTKQSNKFEDSTKDLDLTPYRNKKLEKQGYILCIYLRKNALAEMRYVKMDEVGQIKVDGYVYHERDATYRFGKKNDPVLTIIEGALVPLNKETLRENLGFESAEAQRLIIKGIEQAEVVKAGGLEDKLKTPMNVPKWAIGIGIAVIIGVYAYMGGFS